MAKRQESRGRPGRAAAGGEIVILLFTDLVGSTELFQRLGDDAAEQVRRAHFRLLREAVAARGGHEVKNLGDGLMVAFSSALDAVGSAVAIQEAVRAYNQRRDGPSFHVRVGLDVGEPIRDEGDYFGTPVIVAKRLCDAARGDQILASQLVAGLVGSRGGFSFRSVGRLRLKGLAQPVPAVEVGWQPERARRPAGRGPPTAPRPPPAAARAAKGPKLVGRERELAVLERELARAAAGEFRCLLLVGEPGVGKTRLAAELAARHGADSVVLSARAYPLGETAAFGLWAEALERQLAGLDAADIIDLCAGFLDDLAGLLHSVARARGSAPEREPPRLRLLDGIGAVLRSLAGPAPLLAVLDDIHLADASSWEALQYFARQLSAAPVLVVATARPVELGEQVLANEVLFALEQDGALERVRLEPLDAAGVAALADSVLGEPAPVGLVAWLDERCRGNPLFAHGLLRALLEEGADLSAPALRRLPEGLADRVKTRIARLDPVAVETLEYMAAMGRRVELGEIGRLTGRSPEDMGDVLVRLTRSRMVLEEERGHELIYEVNHPLVQEALYQGISAVRRRRLHREIGRWLHTAGRVAEAAPHFARCAEIGDSEAVEVLREAVRQAEGRGAFREALGILGHLVELLPPGDERWLSVLDAMSRQAEWVIDHRPDETHATIGVKALRAIDAVVERSPDVGRRATVKARLASFLAWGPGELDEAERVAREAAGLFHQAGDQASVLLMGVELAYLKGLKGDWAGMAIELQEVVAAAEAAGDRFAAVQAVGVLGQLDFHRGDFAEAEVKLRQAIEIAREEDKVYRLTWNLTVLGWTLGWEGGRIAEGLAAFEEAKAVNPAWRECNVLELESTVHFVAGDYRKVLECVNEAQVQNPGGMSRRRSASLVFAALAATETGLDVEARRYAAAARGVFGERDWSFATQMCYLRRSGELGPGLRSPRGAPRALRGRRGARAHGTAAVRRPRPRRPRRGRRRRR